ncbi:MAG: hypothetical protein IJU28_07755 [Clostridia bacterium]|nr:hypothetical protein [Clostridia bacterium]
MFAEQKFFVGIQDCGTGGWIKNRSLLENMSDTATVHGKLVGETIEKLAAQNLAWVITNWKLEVVKRVKYASTVTVRTWSAGYNPAFADREYQAFDENGELIAKATSVWMILNTQRNFPQRLNAALMEPYGTEPEQVNFPGFKFVNQNLDQLETVNTVYYTVARSMIDYNRHVHNSAYLDIALEALPEGVDEMDFNNVEISFKREIKPAQRVRLDFARGEGASFVLIHSEDGKTLHTVIKLW